MAYVDFISTHHNKTKRDYVARVVESPKAEAAKIAGQFGKDYWDGDRKYGYGGYKYDGRWLPIAGKIAAHYRLKKGDKVLDVGCGKAFLLYELTQVVPGLQVAGVDISAYGIEHAKPEMKPFLILASADQLPFADKSFDFVFSINTLHNLHCRSLEKALKEIVRVGREKRYIVMESYRNEEEKANLLYWQLTCKAFYSHDDWVWWFEKTGYTGDYSFIHFE